LAVLFLQMSGFGVGMLLAGVVNYAYYILFALIIAWVLISWFPTYPSNAFLQRIYYLIGKAVDPLMRRIRSVIPPLRLGDLALDLSPVVALFALSLGRVLLLTMIGRFVVPVAG
jgi:YggT family protein